MRNGNQEDVVNIIGLIRVHDGGLRNFNSSLAREGQEGFTSSKASRPAVRSPNTHIFSEFRGGTSPGVK
jgi:hypothetical protein